MLENKHPTVAVITRTSRPAVFLERVLEGLQKQTGAQLIWSVVTQRPLTTEHYKCIERAKSSGITVTITQALKGEALGKLANIGINAVESEYIILHDDDDAFNQDFIGPSLKILISQPCVAVACHAAFILEKKNSQSLNFVLSAGEGAVCLTELKSDNLIVVHGLIYKRSAFNAVGGYNENVSVAEDWLFNIKLCKYGNISIFNRVCANVFIRNNLDNNNIASHTDKLKHLEMRQSIRIKEGSDGRHQLKKHNNNIIQKLKRLLDRIIFKLFGKIFPR